MLSRFVAFTRSAARRFPTNMIFLRLRSSFPHSLRSPMFHTGDPALTAPESTVVSLDYLLLPYYALRTTCGCLPLSPPRCFSTFVYATLAAKSRRAALVSSRCSMSAIGADLGFSVVHGDLLSRAFPRLNPGRRMRAVFAIFTSTSLELAFSSISRSAACRAIWSKSHVVLVSRGGSGSGSLTRPSRCPGSSGT